MKLQAFFEFYMPGKLSLNDYETNIFIKKNIKKLSE